MTPASAQRNPPLRRGRVYGLQRGEYPGDPDHKDPDRHKPLLDGVTIAADGTWLSNAQSHTIKGLQAALGFGTTAFHDTYAKHYPDGYTLAWAASSSDPRVQRALKLLRLKRGRGKHKDAIEKIKPRGRTSSDVQVDNP